MGHRRKIHAGNHNSVKIVHRFFIENRQKESKICPFARLAQTAGAARLVILCPPEGWPGRLGRLIAPKSNWNACLPRAFISSSPDYSAQYSASTSYRAQVLLIWAILCHDVEEYEARQQGHDTA